MKALAVVKALAITQPWRMTAPVLYPVCWGTVTWDAHHVPFVGDGIGILGMITERNPVASVIQRQPNREIPVLIIPPGAGLKL